MANIKCDAANITRGAAVILHGPAVILHGMTRICSNVHDILRFQHQNFSKCFWDFFFLNPSLIDNTDEFLQSGWEFVAPVSSEHEVTAATEGRLSSDLTLILWSILGLMPTNIVSNENEASI